MVMFHSYVKLPSIVIIRDQTSHWDFLNDGGTDPIGVWLEIAGDSPPEKNVVKTDTALIF